MRVKAFASRSIVSVVALAVTGVTVIVTESATASPSPVIDEITVVPAKASDCTPLTVRLSPGGGVNGFCSNGVTYGTKEPAMSEGVSFGSSDGTSPSVGNWRSPFCQSTKYARKTGRRMSLSHIGKLPEPAS